MDVSHSSAIQVKPEENRGSDASSSLRHWLAAVDAVLRAIEETVWRLRREALEACQAGREEWADWAGGFRDAQRSLQSWQQQTARLVSIGWVLTKVATGYRLHLTRAAFVSRRRAAVMLERLHAKNAQRFTEVCISHGGGFLKVGQLLSSRPDLMPRVWIEALSILQDSVPAEDEARMVAILEQEMGVSLDEAFREFERTPIASASIGQVHRAVLNDETVVAVKLQRPSIDAVIQLDMQILASFLDAMKTSLPPADYETIVREVRSTISAEVDYDAERAHTSAVGDYLATLEGVRAPKPAGASSEQARARHRVHQRGEDHLDPRPTRRSTGHGRRKRPRRALAPREQADRSIRPPDAGARALSSRPASRQPSRRARRHARHPRLRMLEDPRSRCPPCLRPIAPGVLRAGHTARKRDPSTARVSHPKRTARHIALVRGIDAGRAALRGERVSTRGLERGDDRRVGSVFYGRSNRIQSCAFPITS